MGGIGEVFFEHLLRCLIGLGVRGRTGLSAELTGDERCRRAQFHLAGTPCVRTAWMRA